MGLRDVGDHLNRPTPPDLVQPINHFSIYRGPNRQWRRYYRCLESGNCPYDYSTGHYYGRRELNRMYSWGR